MKLQPLFKLLRKENDLITTQEHQTSLEILKNSLKEACNLSLKMAKRGCQFIIVSDASYYAAGYVLRIEDYHNHSLNPNEKTYAPVAFGSHLFLPAHHSIFVKEFLSVNFAFEAFEHYFWGVTSNPIIVLTDNKSVSRFFQAKKLPTNIWNAVDYVFSLRFLLGHIPGKANAAAEYLSRIHVNPATKFKLKIDNKVPIKNIDIQILSKTPDNSLNYIQNNFYTNETSQNIPTIQNHDDEKTFNVELTALLDVQNRTINAMSEENPLDKLDLNESTSALNIAFEQRNDPDIKEVINWLRAKEKPDTTYNSYDQQKYSKQFGGLVLENQTLYRKYYDHTGKNFTKQLVVPKHLRKEL